MNNQKSKDLAAHSVNPSAAAAPDLAGAIRALSMDAVQAANSGHPGMPMGMADIAVALWTRHLRHNPANPRWSNRDRFVLSNGHGSMLLYSLLHLTGYDLSIDELKRFRQLHSKTPGHPEYGMAPGVETTTGPLGQGIANAVGMAIAERALVAQFNRPGFDIVDHHTYAFMGDGCMMEGISHEVCSLAGTLGLSKLIVLYDDNGISIDSEKGSIRNWYTDDVPKRFAAYGWKVIPDVDGHDVAAVTRAIAKARKSTDRPTLICCKTIIGKGAPTKANTGAVHGAALGDKEIAATRAAIGWPHPPFVIPAEVYDGWSAKRKGARRENEWQKLFAGYKAQFPELAQEFQRRISGSLPETYAKQCEGLLDKLRASSESIASRKASQNAIEALAPILPELIGGSADLAGSNLTMWSGSKPIKGDGNGNYIFYGVREFGMTAIMNGLALHGGFLPYGGTFLTFSDYARNAIRMAALMRIPSIYVYTHDSIGLGEDGPTHQSVEHAASLRLMPNLDVWRPADAFETAVAWMASIERRDGPNALLLSRQNLQEQKHSAGAGPDGADAIRRGGYVLSDAPSARAVLIGTGSELQLAMAAQAALAGEGIAVRVVSMPSTSVFDRQSAAYRDEVLLGDHGKARVPRIAIEAGVTDLWRKYVGLGGAVVGLDRYGESAPAGELFKYFGFTVENIVRVVKGLI